MLITWASVVRTESPRCLAISVLVRPTATSSLTCACLGVRGANHGPIAFPSRTSCASSLCGSVSRRCSLTARALSAMAAEAPPAASNATDAAAPFRKVRRFTRPAYGGELSPRERESDRECRDDEAVGNEPDERVRSKETDHERDREKSENEGQAEPERQHVGRGEERFGFPSVEQRLRAGADDHRCCEQEAETCCIGADDALVEPGRDGDARAADPGQQSDRLRHAHDQRIDEAERLERPARDGEALGRDEDERSDDEERGDVCGRPERGLDLRLERDACERGRQRADDDEEWHAQP